MNFFKKMGLTFGFFYLGAFSLAHAAVSSDPQRVDVVVLGGGAAGLTSFQHLYSKVLIREGLLHSQIKLKIGLGIKK